MIDVIGSNHTIESLFDQLGLDSSSEGQRKFIEQHAGKLNATTSLADASFWSASQSALLAESIAEDGAWASAAGELDGMLRAQKDD